MAYIMKKSHRFRIKILELSTDKLITSRKEEPSLDTMTKFGLSNIKNALMLRDKYTMRMFFQSYYPNYKFSRFTINSPNLLENVKSYLETIANPMVLKPVQGRYSRGIKIVTSQTISQEVIDAAVGESEYSPMTYIEHEYLMLDDYVDFYGVVYVNMFYDEDSVAVITSLRICRNMANGRPSKNYDYTKNPSKVNRGKSFSAILE